MTEFATARADFLTALFTPSGLPFLFLIVVGGLVWFCTRRPELTDRIYAVFGLAVFAAFALILALWVDSVALKVVLFLTVSMAAIDFWRDAFQSSAHKNRNDS